MNIMDSSELMSRFIVLGVLTSIGVATVIGTCNTKNKSFKEYSELVKDNVEGEEFIRIINDRGQKVREIIDLDDHEYDILMGLSKALFLSPESVVMLFYNSPTPNLSRADFEELLNTKIFNSGKGFKPQDVFNLKLKIKKLSKDKVKRIYDLIPDLERTPTSKQLKDFLKLVKEKRNNLFSEMRQQAIVKNNLHREQLLRDRLRTQERKQKMFSKVPEIKRRI